MRGDNIMDNINFELKYDEENKKYSIEINQKLKDLAAEKLKLFLKKEE